MKRKCDLKKKIIELKVKQTIVEENRALNDVDVERGVGYVRTGLAPSLLSELPPGLLDPVIIDDDQSLSSIATSVANECDMGSRPPESIAREDACALEQTRVGWLPASTSNRKKSCFWPPRGRLSSWGCGITN